MVIQRIYTRIIYSFIVQIFKNILYDKINQKNTLKDFTPFNPP